MQNNEAPTPENVWTKEEIDRADAEADRLQKVFAPHKSDKPAPEEIEKPTQCKQAQEDIVIDRACQYLAALNRFCNEISMLDYRLHRLKIDVPNPIFDAVRLYLCKLNNYRCDDFANGDSQIRYRHANAEFILCRYSAYNIFETKPGE